MNVSVEISMYPLHDEYKDKIQLFIDHLNNRSQGVEVRTSNMSTRIFGGFDDVTSLLNAAMKESMRQFGKIVFICKYLEGDDRELRGFE